MSKLLADAYAVELFVEKCAQEFHEDTGTGTSFIGVGIESIIQEENNMVIMNKFIDDTEDVVYGGLITLNNENKYIVINTKYNLRTRYFTLAHELWHVIERKFKEKYGVKFSEDIIDLNERAGDHFAAVLMLPESIVKNIWKQSIQNDIAMEEFVYKVADMSAMTYESVVRRIEELKLTAQSNTKYKKQFKKINTLKEQQIIQMRAEELGYIHPLDVAHHFSSFKEYTDLIQHLVSAGQMDLQSASIKISPYDNVLAAKYMEQLKKEVE